MQSGLAEAANNNRHHRQRVFFSDAREPASEGPSAASRHEMHVYTSSRRSPQGRVPRREGRVLATRHAISAFRIIRRCHLYLRIRAEFDPHLSETGIIIHSISHSYCHRDRIVSTQLIKK